MFDSQRFSHVREEALNLVSDIDFLHPRTEATLYNFGRKARGIVHGVDELADFIKSHIELRTGRLGLSAYRDSDIASGFLAFIKNKEFASSTTWEMTEKTGTASDRLFRPMRIRTLMQGVVDFTHYCVPGLDQPIGTFFQHFAPRQEVKKHVSEIKNAFGEVGLALLDLRSTIPEGQAPLLEKRLEVAGSTLVRKFTSRPEAMKRRSAEQVLAVA